MTLERWTDEQFDSLSWHDNSVHSFRVVEGEFGAGRLVLDIDYILEWRPDPSGAYTFLVAPATLTFKDVTDLKITLDYATPTAALAPFTIDRIFRTVEKRARCDAILWRIPINWPAGEIFFEASGFEQQLRAPPLASPNMLLPRPTGSASV